MRQCTHQKPGFAALGSAGLGIVDVSPLDNPVLQVASHFSEMGCGCRQRNAQRAFVATNDAVHIVSYTDPIMPSLLRTISEPAQSVVAFDGLAVFASNNGLAIADPVSGTILSRLTLPGTGRVTLAREGTRLYAYNIGNKVLSVIDLADPEDPILRQSPVQRGQ